MSSLKELIEHSQKLFAHESIDNQQMKKKVNLNNLINEYHYNFYSHKNYKKSCKYFVYAVFCFTIAIVSIFSYFYLYFFEKNIPTPIYLNFFLYLISISGFGIGMIKYQNIVNRQIIHKFRKHLNQEEKQQYRENRHKFIFSFDNKNLFKKVTLIWLDKRINRDNYLHIAESISKSSILLDMHNTNKSKPLMHIIYNPDAKVRITSYIIALCSLVGVILIKTSDAHIFYELFSKDVLDLYRALLFLAIALVVIIVMYQKLATDITSIIQDNFDDIFKRDDTPNKHRVNRLIQVLILNHEE